MNWFWNLKNVRCWYSPQSLLAMLEEIHVGSVLVRVLSVKGFLLLGRGIRCNQLSVVLHDKLVDREILPGHDAPSLYGKLSDLSKIKSQKSVSNCMKWWKKNMKQKAKPISILEKAKPTSILGSSLPSRIRRWRSSSSCFFLTTPALRVLFRVAKKLVIFALADRPILAVLDFTLAVHSGVIMWWRWALPSDVGFLCCKRRK